MAGLMLMFMLVVMVVLLFYRLVMQKPVKKLLLSYSIILGSYFVIVSCTCGPNPKDVAVMKPMVEKISDYIVKNGIPKSLKDIQGLPYELECSKSNSCYFISNSNRYSISFYKPSYGGYELKVMSYKTKTAYKNYFNISKNNHLIFNENDSGAYSLKSTGICSSMKQ